MPRYLKYAAWLLSPVVLLAVLWATIYTSGRSGICLSEMRWLSDDELLARALSSPRFREWTGGQTLQDLKRNGPCCRIVRDSSGGLYDRDRASFGDYFFYITIRFSDLATGAAPKGSRLEVNMIANSCGVSGDAFLSHPTMN